MKDTFTKIYKEYKWKWEDDSENGKFRSGSGRNPEEIERTGVKLASLFGKYGWKTLADIGCGDYLWMQIVLPLLKVKSPLKDE